jgi:hypothetical protein
MVVTTILFAHTTFLWVTYCLIFFFVPIVKPFLTHWSWLRVVPFIERGNRAHGGCDQSTGDAHPSMAPDPTSDIYRGPCTHILCIVFIIGLWDCFAYEDFSKRGKLLTKKLMFQGYNESRLKSSFPKFYGRYNDLLCEYKLSPAQMLNDLFHTIC